MLHLAEGAFAVVASRAGTLKVLDANGPDAKLVAQPWHFTAGSALGRSLRDNNHALRARAQPTRIDWRHARPFATSGGGEGEERDGVYQQAPTCTQTGHTNRKWRWCAPLRDADPTVHCTGAATSLHYSPGLPLFTQPLVTPFLFSHAPVPSTPLSVRVNSRGTRVSLLAAVPVRTPGTPASPQPSGPAGTSNTNVLMLPDTRVHCYDVDRGTASSFDFLPMNLYVRLREGRGGVGGRSAHS